MVCGKTIYMKFQALLLQNSEFTSFIYSVMIGDLGFNQNSFWMVCLAGLTSQSIAMSCRDGQLT